MFGLAPTARAADELAHGAGIRADTIDKLLHEHHRPEGPRPDYRLAPRTVVVIDEAGMVDTLRLFAYHHLAEANGWRTVLVGDHQQLGSINAGGMFAELVHDPDVVTCHLTELHRFTHQWEADATLQLRDRHPKIADVYDDHGRIHAHRDLDTTIERLARHAARLHTNGVGALVLTHTRSTTERLNQAITDTLLDAGHLDPAAGFDIDGHRFYPGQQVMSRRNNRRIHHSADTDDYVRNGNRYTIHQPHPLGGLTVTTQHGTIAPIPARYITDGHLEVSYASTIHAAQGATVDETHTLATPTMGADALYVAMTRGRHTNHIHLHPPTFEPDQQHGPAQQPDEPWTARQTFTDICHNDHTSIDTAIDRRRQLRHHNIDPAEHEQRRLANLDDNNLEPAPDLHVTSADLAAAGRPAADRDQVTHIAAAERPAADHDLQQPDEPTVASPNAQLRAQLAAARLRAPTINRADDGIGLDL